MKLTDLSFSRLRRILLDLDFTERMGRTAHRVFEHEASDTIFIFRQYKSNEKIHYGDLFSVRKQLDERGLLPAESFDQLLRKNSA